MKKSVIALILLGCIFQSKNCFSQTDSSVLPKPLNNIGLSLLGNGSVLSVNYERLFVINELITLSANTGLGVNYEFSMLSRVSRYIVFPQNVSTNWRIGRRGSLEIGMGASIYHSENIKWPVLYYPLVGYRHQPLKPNRLGFKITGCLPVINKEYPTLFYPVGLTMMYSF